ncbi:MAG: hypothetical protein JJ877_00585 [Thalassococcus sp.]|uniref:hypothetical protein n=1 Tax=Thalassococcus sp. TaxID=1928858 RepID=UPI001B2C9B41|nr:hypothetical protein [Thalassococcus sp.]MBO6865510.1 hypothetical protein [Thalassococcus sp.]
MDLNIAKMSARRFITLAVLLSLLALGIFSFLPEKRVDKATQVTPIEWLNEDELLVRIANDYFVRTSSGALAPSRFDAAPSNKTPTLGVRLRPVKADQIWRDGEHEYIELSGEKHRIATQSYLSDRYGMNQGFPPEEFVDFYTYLHLGKVGLVTFDDPDGRKTELPLQYDGNSSLPVVKLDRTTNMFFAFQNACGIDDATGECTRSAWWVNSNMELISSFLLPIDDPYSTREKLSCFSCGCGCYTHQDTYAVNGQAFFHYAGFPISKARQGLYRVVETTEGKSEWRHEIKGRIAPSLAFSPSGCKVAFFRVSYWGDELRVEDLCD